MFKTKIKYTDFIGNEQEEVLRFNLSEDELRTLIDEDKSFDPSYLAYVSSEQNFMAMYKIVRKLILKSYGVMSEDAKYFDKSDEVTNRFLHSAVYQEFLDYLMDGEDLDKLRAFITGVFPKKFSEEIAKQITTNNLSVVQ